MKKDQTGPLAEFDEFAARGRTVVAHCCASEYPYPEKRKQALKILFLGEQIAKLVVLESRARQNPNRKKTVSSVQKLQNNYVSILRGIGGRARASATGFQLIIPTARLLQIKMANWQASRLLRKYERMNAEPAVKNKKKSFLRRRRI